MKTITKTVTVKHLMNDLGVDKSVAYNFLKGVTGLGLATVSTIDRPGVRGRREVAYTLDDSVVTFLSALPAPAVVPSMTLVTKTADGVATQVEVAPPTTEASQADLPVLDLVAFEASEPDLEYTPEELAQFPQAAE